MNRRTLIAAIAAMNVSLAMPVFAGETLDYRDGLIDDLLAEGRTLFVDFAADWCSTCRAQERIIDAYRAERPEIEDAVTFVRVDWDQFSQSDIVSWYDIPRRSTLLVLRGEDEIGRIVAGTSRAQIYGLLDAALAAGTS
jgi:thiol-disulfide isomerase/thioredoxin